jgi:hypothetical protein
VNVSRIANERIFELKKKKNKEICFHLFGNALFIAQHAGKADFFRHIAENTQK